jgi:predicted ATPase
VSGNLEESGRLGELCVAEALKDGAPELAAACRFCLGSSLFHLGQLAESRLNMESAVPAFGNSAPAALALFAGPDLGVFCRSYLSQLLWLLGHPDLAEAKVNETIALAGELANPFTLAIALDYAAMLHVFRQESKLALARAVEAADLCRKHGFAYYLAWADILAGWATAFEGDPASGLAELRCGIEALKSTGAELRLPFYYGLLAEVHGLMGQTSEALANMATALAFQNKHGETWYSAELQRIHGDLLAKAGDACESQNSYRRAVEAARLTGARMFEARAAARLEESPAARGAQANTGER